MTQCDRVLAALYRHPDRGISQVDFLRYPTIDGGPPITRLAARVNELRDQGHLIVDAGIREKCKVYCLARELVEAASDPVPGRDKRVVEPVPPPAAPDGQLFAAPTRRLNSAIYGDEAA